VDVTGELCSDIGGTPDGEEFCSDSELPACCNSRPLQCSQSVIVGQLEGFA